ncbi:putative DNA repair protein rad5 [Boletus reticuloceps]|uniref:Putative DNA repair protein rad5 n=1 Tax=Boletus reticuloceps TaxID=495285 RepID=A0A8I3AAS7_9AGAM|nr:putative DNA repair protein rad5 [Boletus reticuloceps]
MWSGDECVCRSEDQKKVRRAIAVQCVDPADVPASTKVAAPPAMMPMPGSSMPGPSSGAMAMVGQKRKYQADDMAASQSFGQSSFPNHNGAQGARGSFGEEDEEVATNEPEPADELYCVLKTSIVGVQYYKGLVGPGEQVRLVREPNNRYDRNAIQVQNIGGAQVGHIPRNVASQLAPLLDRGLVTVEGDMHEGNRKALSMSLNIYGPSDKRDMLEPMLIWATPRQTGFPPRAGGGVPGVSPAAAAAAAGALSVAGGVYPSAYAPAFAATMGMPGPSQARGMTSAQSEAQQEAIRKQNEAYLKAAELRQMLSGLERVDDENRRASLLDTLLSTGDILNLPVHPNPPGIANGELVVDLLKHQSQALQWCIGHEYPKFPSKEEDSPVQFWQYRKVGNKWLIFFVFLVATKSPQDIGSPPTLGRGALVADSMGLGKTLTMISLILATKKDVPRGYCNSTLIVVPLSVISNWEKQIEEHCVRGTLSVCLYYGAGRNMTPQQLMTRDVVITTYQVVSGDADFSTVGQNGTAGEGPAKKKKKHGKGLFEVKWKRIVLDEGHNIRNPKTKMAMAVCMLTAERRWVLSGTPIVSDEQFDLGSILTFLQICHPLDNEDFFKRLVLRPLKQGDPSGAELLRALMGHVCLRRTKEVSFRLMHCSSTFSPDIAPKMQDSEGNSLVPLPPVDITVVPVTLNDEARKLYDAVELASRQRVENLMNQVGGLNPVVTTNVLSMLTRLRQIALHPGLIPADYLDQLQANEDVNSSSGSAVQVTPELKAKLETLILQAIEDNEECPICFGVITDPRITSCTHVFCLTCISEVIARDPKCPMDRRPLTMQDLVVPPPPTDHTQALTKQGIDESDLCIGSSAKIDQLIHLLKLIPHDAKSLVFSQFTSFLDKIGEALEENGIPYARFDGQLSARKRQEVLERFSIPLDPDESPAPGEPLPSTHLRQTQTQLTVEDDEDGNDSDFVAGNDTDDDDFDEDISTRVKKNKGKGKAKAIPVTKQVFDASAFYKENPKVLLISLKAGALGLNLTVANHVFLMDPWWQEGIESQAIDRCNRIGQKKPVHVYQLIAENTVESKAGD